MIIAQVIQRPRRGLLGFGGGWRRRPVDGDVALYRCRRYVDGTVNVQASTAKAAPEGDDILVELKRRSFDTLLTQSGLTTADNFEAELALTVTWRVADPRHFLGELSYRTLREHGYLSAEHAAALLQHQCRRPLASAVAAVHYVELKRRSDEALAALEDALRKGGGAALDATVVAISTLLSSDGEAHLAAEAQAKAKLHEAEAATAAAKAEEVKIKAKTKVERARAKADAEWLSSIGSAVAGRRSGRRQTTTLRTPREVLAGMAKRQKLRQQPLIAIEHKGHLVRNSGPNELPIAFIGDPVSYRIRVERYGAVLLILNASDGCSQLLMPNRSVGLESAQVVSPLIDVPPPQLQLFSRQQLKQQGPEGREQIIAILCQEPALTDDELDSTRRDKYLLSELLLGRIIERLRHIPSDAWSADVLEYGVQESRRR